MGHGQPSRILLGKLLAASVLSTLVLHASPTAAQVIGTANFPDTAVGASTTVKCPETSMSLCFGSNCSASGTVQSVSGPGAPFSIAKLNLLTSNQFFGGACEANPVSLPVTVGAGQILAFQATFSPTAPGTFNSSVTFSTAGGPATVNLAGKGISATSQGQGLGLVGITVSPAKVVPGNLVEISYETSPGTLQGKVDIYFAVVMPGSAQLLFLSANGFTTAFAPLRQNVTVLEEIIPLLRLFPVDIPFGTYELQMAFVHAGQPPSFETLASPIASATATFQPLSEAQQATLRQRGNPDYFSMFWIDEAPERREVWLYLSGNPAEYVFVSGALESLTVLSDPPPGGATKVDPGLFTPQTSPAQLTALFGEPASQSPVEGLLTLTYSNGLEAIFRNGRLSSVYTVAP